ncbi:hypothetical protein BO71DRAFT_453876 [Aspergillus ellipticus CBS 707.79]|uniref:DUF967 domain protein n=1 Tax=Aspergillus ellipticus CBS 707.79 TaxID=1448320 RepID=A0A319CW83_9EURO|nr:hypothetical protein BO71DRAFT_453876 [Aspergillus ellipticus CBS 707.79]
MASESFSPSPADPALILAQEQALVFPTFTTTTAWSLGVSLRARILALPADMRRPAVISICLSGSSAPQLVFHCATAPGTRVDHALWLKRKTQTVLRWQVSTWYLRCRLAAAAGAEDALGTSVTRGMQALAEQFALSPVEQYEYALQAGGVPIRVEGVEGVVGVIAVSGLEAEAADHEVIVDAVQEFLGTKGEQLVG